MPEGSRRSRSRSRSSDRSLEERLEGWIDRGRDFVDGVAAGRAAPRRRPLEALSRRGVPPAADDWADDWPDDASFSLNRWQRPEAADVPPAPAPREGGRPLPRSSRRRP
jgi:hypothetical protein